MLRLLSMSLYNIMIMISHTSPNHNIETNNVDQMIEPMSNYFIKNIAMILIVNFLNLYHMYIYGDETISFFEFILIIMGIMAFTLRMWSYITLDKYFTFNLCIKKDHQLVETGPYQYLVHPSYTGLIGLMLSYILFHELYVIIPFYVYMSYGIIKRTEKEEKMLKEHFGEKYDKFLEGRWRLIPYIY